ncbi:MAG: mechanosensitive ion channel family protein [Gemmatimonadetes bacterium]|nr:mechanosensitive ion channel family protein [Gemmatimonadota bacterium]
MPATPLSFPLVVIQAAGPESDPRSGNLVTDAAGLLDLVLDTSFRLLPRLALAALVLAAFVGISFIVRALLRRVFERAHLERDVAEILQTLARYVAIGLGVMLALENLGLNVTSVLAGLGIVGIALGFAAKDTLANLIAGITILWDRPFRVGDRIEVSGSEGVVQKITLRTTRLDTPRNEVVILPNQNMMTEKIVNHTMRPSLRIDIPFGIAYRHEVEDARRVVLAIVQGDENIRAKPEPQVVVTALADSSVNLQLRFWLKDPRLEIPMEFRYTEKIKAALDAAEIEIPFPQMVLHVAGEAGTVRVLPDGGASRRGGGEPSVERDGGGDDGRNGA